jgi:hypothetical protein
VQTFDLALAVGPAISIAVFESPRRLIEKLLLPAINLVRGIRPIAAALRSS